MGSSEAESSLEIDNQLELGVCWMGRFGRRCSQKHGRRGVPRRPTTRGRCLCLLVDQGSLWCLRRRRWRPQRVAGLEPYSVARVRGGRIVDDTGETERVVHY